MCFTSYLGLYKNDSFDLTLLDYILNYKIHSNTFITHFSKFITLLNQLLITKHIGEELIFSSTQTTPIWYSLYFQKWNNLSSKVDKIWFIQKQRIERLSMEVTTKSSHIESYFLTHSIHPFPPSFHFPTIRPIGCDHSLLPVESPKSKQTTNHFHPIQQFLFHHANLKPLHWINTQCVVEFLHLDG